jgi:hypothetical protein
MRRVEWVVDGDNGSDSVPRQHDHSDVAVCPIQDGVRSPQWIKTNVGSYRSVWSCEIKILVASGGLLKIISKSEAADNGVVFEGRVNHVADRS